MIFYVLIYSFMRVSLLRKLKAMEAEKNYVKKKPWKEPDKKVTHSYLDDAG